MNVKQFSESVGVSSHTIRYYDKLGLLGEVQRLPNGHRHFSDKDVEWIKFIQRLKDTGMAIDRMLQYAKLRSEGEGTMRARKQILEAHANVLREQILDLQCHMENLTNKIAWYGAALSKQESS